MPYVKTTSEPRTEIYFQDHGEGQPVILIHGWPLSHRMWERQVHALTEAGFRCVAYDRRGFGDSGRPPGGYDYDTFAADLNDLITELDLRDLVLVGFSMGGGEVARHIGRYGENRIAKAALLGGVPPFLLRTDDNPDGIPRAQFEELIASARNDRLAFLDGFFPNFYNTDEIDVHPDLLPYSKWIAWAASPQGTMACITAFGTTDFRDDLRRITVPTLILHGDADRIVPIDISGRKSHERIAGSRFEIISGAPHGFAATHPEPLERVLLDFLRS